jgi:DNA-directed RNA polymerase subunit K/omega
VLTIKGEKKAAAEVKEEQFHHAERRYGSFSRSFSLPQTVDPHRVSAEYKNGVLTVRLPQREEAKPRTIKDETTPQAAPEPQPEAPAIPPEPLPPIQSRFLFVDVAALRAKQLRRGARIRIDDTEHLPKKAERVAMEEVRRGLVYYNIPEPKRRDAESHE